MTQPLNLSAQYLSPATMGDVARATLPRLAVRLASRWGRIITFMNNAVGGAECVSDPNVMRQL